MFLNKSENPIEPIKSDTAIRISLVICVAGIILAGLFSGIFDGINMIGMGL
jgi:hypothetical protein